MSQTNSPKLPARLVFLLATGAGFGVAALYCSQPMLGSLGADLGASDRAVGFVPTLTQFGYAFGILLLAPLGDRVDRRTIILWKGAILTAALLAAALAPSIGLLLAASLIIGITSTLAQDIIPVAATLAPEAERGKVVGTVMTGLLLGILLSRVVSGAIAEHFGWRQSFFAAAGLLAALFVANWRGLPRIAPTTRLAYGDLLISLGQIWLRHPRLRRAAWSQGLLSVGFSAFWSTLAVMLHAAPFHLGSGAAGAFGLAGAAGALAAPVAGRLADRHGPARVTMLGAGLTTLSFAVMSLGPLLSQEGQIILLVICTIGFDLGAQAALIAHQTIIYALDPTARSRMNALLLTGMFIGMAAGAAAGSFLLAELGWTGVTLFATLVAFAALANMRYGAIGFD
jgi:predicted MFS family arabinose efflux permease